MVQWTTARAFIPYYDEAEVIAIAIANDSELGPHGTEWTKDVERGVEMSRRIRTGTYSVNAMSLDPAAPFCAVKNPVSGVRWEV
jgi:aldehyde dehydrogenase (NAD+)